MSASQQPLAQRLRLVAASGTRALWLQTTEERRAIHMFESIAAELGWPLHTWSASAGVDATGTPESLPLVLSRLLRTRGDELWLLLDGAEELRDSITRRSLRELAQRSGGPTAVLVGPASHRRIDIPELVVERLPLPTREEILVHLRWVADELTASGHAGAAHLASADVGTNLAHLLAGLDMPAIDQVLAEGVATHGADSPALAKFVVQAKSRRLAQLELLQQVEALPMAEVGGLEHLKGWLRRRTLALDPAARELAIPPPRGLLLVGVQGCGKSLVARACADALSLPLFRLEPGRLFGGTVGESEANLRDMTTLADRLAPMVLWIDEVDKGLAGTEGSASDAGTSARVLGALLTWLQDREGTVFVVATANRIDGLPPELLRRGRLDEIFFLDLPSSAEREEILRVHLEVQPSRTLGHVPPIGSPWSEFAAVARTAEGFSGAELASALIEARIDAYAERRPVDADDLRRALASSVPLSRSRAESVESLRRWATERARRA